MARRNCPLGRSLPLGVEALEGRDLPAASPLPVLMVLADQRDYVVSAPAVVRAAPAGDYSAVVFVGGWGAS